MIDQLHILLWSGGFDSTTTLIKLACNPDQYKKVLVVGCELTTTFNCLEDKKAREVISKKFIDDPRYSHLHFIELDDLKLNFRNGSMIGQSSVWALISSGLITEEDSDVVFVYGYIRGDDFWHGRYEFESAVRCLIYLQKKNIKIKFSYPFEWQTKRDILTIYLNFSKIFDEISWAGDTESVKLKERDELFYWFCQLLEVHKNSNRSSLDTTKSVDYSI
jgi:hypothetical protein